MHVLLTGAFPQAVWTIAQRLVSGGHKVSLLGHIEAPHASKKGIAYHDIDIGSNEAVRWADSIRAETVIFFYSWQCEQVNSRTSALGSLLDALLRIYRQSVTSGAGRFILITDQRVFGVNQACGEVESPLPDSSDGHLIKTAEDCLLAQASGSMELNFIRVTSLYEHGSQDSFFSHAVSLARTETPLALEGNQETPCDFLHADDLAIYLNLTLGCPMAKISHLSSGRSYTYGDLENLLQKLSPGMHVSYSHREGRTGRLQGSSARSADWFARHDVFLESEGLCAITASESKKKVRLNPRWQNIFRLLTKFAELLVFGLLAAYLDQLELSFNLLGSVNFMLLYTAIIGYAHGRHFGQLAALIACLHYAFRLSAEGSDISLILFNPDHWLPISSYLLSGSLFGYLRDKSQTLADSLQGENVDLKTQNEFLNKLYRQVYEDREKLNEQVMHTRDSFGRIYRITQELDAVIPQKIFVSALAILEDVLQNQSVAIYEYNSKSSFARLVVRSRALRTSVKSIDAAQYGDVMARLNKGKAYANRNLQPDMPAYAAPVIYEGKLVAMLFLWSVPFEKQSQYYENLFSVLTGLVQDSLGRALRQFKMAGDMYVEGTQILMDAPFRSALEINKTIHKQRIGQYLLVRVKNAETMTPEKADSCISQVVRANDVAGRLNDGCYYILFSQASKDDFEKIVARFRANAKRCDLYLEVVADV